MNIGILGGGQLARMIALSGYPLGQKYIILDPSAEAGAVPLGKHLHGNYDDPSLLQALAEQADIVTYEFENVPADTAHYLSEHTQVYPAANALAVAQDRLMEKQFFRKLGIETAPFAAVDSLQDLKHALAEIGYPAIIKSRRFGYDGKGQVVIKTEAEVEQAWQSMQNVPSILEGFVNFDREVSIIAARSTHGEIAFYPLSENEHRGGILRIAEAKSDDPLQDAAEQAVTGLLNELGYVGVVALELFDVQGKLVANEFAPRVHNSGHWTIEGCYTSQFENHVRAILGLPLGHTNTRGFAGMVNFIGGLPNPEQVLNIEYAHLHLYDKSARKGRKVAHATVCCSDEVTFANSLQQLVELAEASDDS